MSLQYKPHTAYEHVDRFQLFKYRQLSELVNSNYFKLENETLVACCSNDVLGVNAEPFSEHIRQSSAGFLRTNCKPSSIKTAMHQFKTTFHQTNAP